MMSRLGAIGLTLLWLTGLTLVCVKYGAFTVLPWQFFVKLAAAVVLTVAWHTHTGSSVSLA